VLHIAVRAWLGLRGSPVPWPVKLHVALAFANMMLASVFGMVVGLNRIYGWFAWSPMSAAFAHAHLGAVGWAVMMVVGLSYRLIPMIVPAEMPNRRSMAVSAVLLEIGTLGLAIALITRSAWTTVAAGVIVAGIGSFVYQVRQIIGRTLPAPPALPRPDWATWQTHLAFIWLLLAACTGFLLTLPVPVSWIIGLGWLYGTAGLVGFLAQIVVGIQGRLLPLYGWYRLMESNHMQPPARSVHTLARHGLSKAVLVMWTIGVPSLVFGLLSGSHSMIAMSCAVLLGGVALNASHVLTIITAE
jgi:hypothetical protein